MPNSMPRPETRANAPKIGEQKTFRQKLKGRLKMVGMKVENRLKKHPIGEKLLQKLSRNKKPEEILAETQPIQIPIPTANLQPSPQAQQLEKSFEAKTTPKEEAEHYLSQIQSLYKEISEIESRLRDENSTQSKEWEAKINTADKKIKELRAEIANKPEVLKAYNSQILEKYVKSQEESLKLGNTTLENHQKSSALQKEQESLRSDFIGDLDKEYLFLKTGIFEKTGINYSQYQHLILTNFDPENNKEIDNHKIALAQHEFNLGITTLSEVLQNNKVFLMHGISDVDTGGNAVIEGDFNLDIWKKKIDTLFKSPTVSASTYNSKTESNQIWGNIQVVYGGESKIYDAYKSDASSYAVSLNERVARSPRLRKDKIDILVDKAINRPVGSDSGKYLGDHNELFVSGVPVAVNIDLDKIQNVENIGTERKKLLIDQILYAIKDMPLYITKNGKMFEAKFFLPKMIREKQKNGTIELTENEKTHLSVMGFDSMPNPTLYQCFVIGKEVSPDEIAKLSYTKSLKK